VLCYVFTGSGFDHQATFYYVQLNNGAAGICVGWFRKLNFIAASRVTRDGVTVTH
jgi:hypothetical protein